MNRLNSLLNNISELKNELQSFYDQLKDEKDNMFYAVVETTPNFVGIIQHEKFVFVNSTGLKLLQHEDLSEVIGESIFELLHSDNHPTIRERLSKLNENIPNNPIHIRLKKSNGSYIDLEASSTPFVFNNAPAGLIAGRDITEELKQKEKIEEEKKLREVILNSFTEHIAFYNSDHSIRWMNDAAKMFYKITDDSYIGQYCHKLRFNSDTPCTDCPMHTHKGQTHERIVHDRDIIWKITHTPLFDNLGEISGYIERSIDITQQEKDRIEIQKSEKDLKESEQRFREIFENSHDNIFLIEVTDDMHFRNLDFNPAFEKQTGKKRSELIGKFQEEVLPEKIAKFRNEQFRQCVKTKKAILNQEIKLTPPLGTSTFLSSIIPITDPTGKIYRILGIYRDITEQKQTEKLLKKKQVSLEEAQRLGKIGSWELDLHTGHIERTDEIFRICELDPQNKVSNDVFIDLIHPDDRDRVLQTLRPQAYSVKNMQPSTIEYRIMFPDGHIKYLSESCETYYDEEGMPFRCIGTLQDISERIQYEQKLNGSILFIERIIDSLPEPIFIKDRQHRFILSNDAHCKFRGLSREELIGKTDFDLFPTSEAETFWNDEEEIFEVGRETNYDHYIDDAEGNRSYIVLRKVCFTGSDGEKYLAGTIHDITEREEYQQQLEMLTHALDNTHEAAFIQEMSNPNFLYVNDRACKLLGYSKEEMKNITLYDIDPSFTEEQMQRSDEVLPSVGSISFESNHKRKDGTTFPIECTVTYFQYNNTDYLVSLTHDITERKLAEKALRESEEKFATVFKLSPASLAITRLRDNVMLDVNDIFLQDSGRKYEEVVGSNQYDIDLGINIDDFEPLRSMGNVQNFEYNFVNKEGKTEYGLLSLAIISIGGEQCVLSQSVMITELKNKQQELVVAHNKLKESEQRYREIFENSHESIFLLSVEGDQQFRVLDVNPQYEKEVGITRDQNVGKLITETVPVHVASKVSMAYQKCVDNKQVLHGQMELELPVGKRIFDSAIIPIFDTEGNVYRIAGITNDITEETQLKQDILNEKERYQFLIETAPVGVMVYVKDKLRLANKRMLEIAEVSSIQELSKISMIDNIHPDDFNVVTPVVEKVSSGNLISPLAVKFRVLNSPTGLKYLSVIISNSIIGNQQYTQVLVSDITSEEEKEKKVRNLAADAIYLNQKNKLIDILDEEIDRVIQTKNTYTYKDLKQIHQIIKGFSQSEQDWELFKSHIDELHPDFFSRLKAEFPRLTQYDIKHCTYIKLNFDTKEVARFFNVKPETILIARSRMKKKMNLSSSVNLRDFILQY